MSDAYTTDVTADLQRVVQQAVRAQLAIEGIGKSSQKAGNQASFFGKQMQSALSSSIEQIRGFILAQVGVQAALGAITSAIAKAKQETEERRRAGTGLAKAVGPGSFADPLAAIEELRAAGYGTGLDDAALVEIVRGLTAGYSAGGGKGQIPQDVARRAVFFSGQFAQAGQDGAAFAEQYARMAARGVAMPEQAIAGAVLANVPVDSVGPANAAQYSSQEALDYLLGVGRVSMERERRRQYDSPTIMERLFGRNAREFFGQMFQGGDFMQREEAARRAAFDAANQVPERPEVGAVQRIADRVSVAPIQQ